jgi:uncharacterized phage infection (PIP) family protein YhgE
MQGRLPSSSGGGSGNQSQQQLMEQAEQLKRQLQRLSRERSSPQLNTATQQLQKAIDEMRKALQGGKNSAESGAQQARALQQLNDAMRRLERSRESGLSQGVEQAMNESGKLVEEQKRVQEELDRLSKDAAKIISQEELKERREDLMSRKNTLADRLRGLDSRIRDLSRQARGDQKEASRRLSDASGIIQDKRLPERIMSGNSMIQNGLYESQKQREDFIRGGLEELNKQLEAAKGSIGQSREGKLEEAADRVRQLAEGLESMQQRAGGRPSSEADSRRLSRNAEGLPSGIGSHRDEEYRQWGSELEQRLSDAQEIRRLLDRNSTQTDNLNRVLEALRQAGTAGSPISREQIARLKSSIDYLRNLELDLIRELDRMGRKEKYYFAEDNEAPGKYQKLVEEYYKSIARSDH